MIDPSVAPLPTASTQRPDQLRVAIAGLGFGESVHLPALQAGALTKPVALWHPRPQRVAEAAERAGLKAYHDFDALLADPDIEALVIATPPGPRFDLAKAALEAGRHLLLEKPVALNGDQVQELQRLALQRNLCVAVDFEYRAVPLFLQMADLLAAGVVGDPWLVRIDWLMGSRSDPARPWSWYSQGDAGGGVLGALGTHAFDMLHWWFGPVRSVQGLCSTAIRERPLAAGHGAMGPVDAEDIALVQLELEGGNGRPIPAQMSLASVARQGRGCWIEIYGSEATLVLGSDNQSDYVHGFQLWLGRPGETLRPVPADPRHAFARTWGDGRVAPVLRLQQWWAEAIRDGRPMVPGLTEALSSQRCCDQIRFSRSGWSSAPSTGAHL
jgi:predicted dehydrogenase